MPLYALYYSTANEDRSQNISVPIIWVLIRLCQDTYVFFIMPK